ncbi:MAG TPA: L-rhamnose mutarotase [Puia sp.]|nr:L-rhamnose mutarotase [Puia sp.]
MQRIAFCMRLHKGCEEEYHRRHAVLWPELSALLHETGIREYSIFLEPETLQLFAFLQIADPAALDRLAEHPVMQRWWDYMKDIMDTHPDHSPVTKALKEVFYLS